MVYDMDVYEITMDYKGAPVGSLPELTSPPLHLPKFRSRAWVGYAPIELYQPAAKQRWATWWCRWLHPLGRIEFQDHRATRPEKLQPSVVQNHQKNQHPHWSWRQPPGFAQMWETTPHNTYKWSHWRKQSKQSKRYRWQTSWGGSWDQPSEPWTWGSLQRFEP